MGKELFGSVKKFGKLLFGRIFSNEELIQSSVKIADRVEVGLRKVGRLKKESSEVFETPAVLNGVGRLVGSLKESRGVCRLTPFHSRALMKI